MKPKTIGIVGGAGPLAGVSLLERLFRYAQVAYGCFQDADFPKVLLVSFPFSDMLGKQIDKDTVAKELREALQFLRKSGATVLGIACNTLHTLLDEGMEENLLKLPQLTASEIECRGRKKPMILCTSTSRQSGLYNAFFPCTYPDLATQQLIDEIILTILKGNGSAASSLASLIRTLEAETIVLGCTELSLYSDQFEQGSKRVIDPLDILAKALINQSLNITRPL